MMPIRERFAAPSPPAALPFLSTRRFSTPDQLLVFDHGRLSVVGIGDTVLGQALFEPGWHWTPAGRGSRAAEPLVGLVLGGRLGLSTATGRAFDLIEGDVFQASLTRGLEARVVGYRPAEVLYVRGVDVLARGLRE